MSILSIHSSVAHGYVGNAGVVPVLQRLGYDVWPVDTVRFSNHPGHGAWRGKVIAAREVAEIITGLDEHGLFPACQAVLSGYLGKTATATVVAETVARLRSASGGAALYCCDPVIGDDAEGLYVPVAVAKAIAARLIPIADIIVPNAFELAYFSGHALEGTYGIDDLTTACAAARVLLAKGPRLVVATSVPGTRKGTIATIAVSADQAWWVETPLLKTPAKGAGDVFTALFLGHYLSGENTGAALSDAVSTVFALIEATAAAESAELLLVPALANMINPSRRFTARRMP